MRRRPRTRRGAWLRDESGIALVGVMGVMIVLTMFLLTTLAFTLQNLQPSRRDQDAKVSLAAAQAGIDDYVARLNADPQYWTLGPVTSNPAFRAGRPVPGSPAGAASFRYSLLTTPADVAAGGVIRLKSTGIFKSTQRSLTASFQPSSFLNFIYHTDLENLDPVLWTTNATQIANCSKYWYAGRSSSGCQEIQFPGSDVIAGPAHTNDVMSVGNTNPAVTFGDPQTETSWNIAPFRLGSATPRGNQPRYAPPVAIPASNDELRTVAADPTGVQGCTYTGATKIVFTGATMSVLSPGTSSSATPAACYATAPSLRGTLQAGLAIPKVIYVDDLVGPCATGGTSLKTGLGDPGVPGDPGYPRPGEYVGSGSNTGLDVWSSSYHGPVYDCKDGTAYVQGTLNDTVTIGTTQDVVVTGDLNYQDGTASSTNVLGLIPGHFAWVYHPVRNTGSTGSPVFTNMLTTPVTQIDAAILTVKDSFIVQNYDLGPAISSLPSTNLLTVTGAISQKFRGRVAGSPSGTQGAVSNGYIKNYLYDQRFQRGVQPPYFLKPVSAQWAIRRVTDG